MKKLLFIIDGCWQSQHIEYSLVGIQFTMTGTDARFLGKLVGIGAMLDDFLHLVDGQCDALVVGSLQPQGNDACCDGRCHRRTVGFHPSVASWGGLTFKLIREILVGNDIVEFIVHERVAGTIDTVTGCYHEGMQVAGIVSAIAGVSGYIAYRFLCISCWFFTWFANNQIVGAP